MYTWLYWVVLHSVNVINIPTYLTLFRVVIVPFFIMVFYLPMGCARMVCTVMFFVAAVTDWFDGFLARRWKQTTSFGQFLDPVADKIMVVSALILIAEHFHVWWITLPIFSMIIREVIILALREWVAKIGGRHGLSVSSISKIKTCTQMLALTALLWSPDEWIIIVGIIALYISVLLTFWSMYLYLCSVRDDLLA